MGRISTLFLAILLAITAFSANITDDTGRPVNGLLRVSILIYNDADDIIWTGTTDGSLPSLRVENGEMVNLDDLIPSYVKRGDLRIEIRQNGRLIAEQRMESSPLHRASPEEPGDISETMATHLKIGDVGETDDLVVHSPRTGFGITEPVERVDIDGALGLREGAAPTATTDFGKVYVDDGDGHLYFLDESGVATDLLETSEVGGSGIITAFSTDQIHTCIGNTLNLGVHQSTSTGPYTHLWTGDTAPLSATDIPNPSFTASSSGSYVLSYSVTDGSGNSSTYYLTVVVHGNPSPSITATPSTGGCAGEPVVLSGDGCYEKYCWNPGGPCSKSFMATESGTYELTVIDRWGCEGTASRSVTFLDPPIANSGSNHSVCYGGSDPLIGGSPSATSGVPPYSYEWSGTGLPYLSSATAGNPSFDASSAAPGVYNLTLTVTDANGCSDEDGPVLVTIYDLPVASAIASSPVCPGNTITLSGGATGGTAPYSYSWTGPDGFSSFAQNPEITGATEANQGTYSLTVTDAHGCISLAATAGVMVDDPVMISANPTDETVCEGLSASFTVSATGTGPFTYQWQRSTDGGSSWSNTGTDSDTYEIVSVALSMDGNRYRCQVSSDCPPSQTSTEAVLAVMPAPSISIHPADISVLESNPATFSVSASGDALTYQWQRNTGSGWSNLTGATSSSYTISSVTAGMDGYQYRCIVSGACPPPDTSDAALLTIDEGLYTFSSHTFTNCGATGRTGPTLSACRSAYSTTWDENPAYFNMTSQGIQIWTVPVTGSYRITAIGGGNTNDGGGMGASMAGTFELTSGEKLQIVVGQESPSSQSLSGSGGSFVALGESHTTATPLIVAGGGATGFWGVTPANSNRGQTGNEPALIPSGTTRPTVGYGGTLVGTTGAAGGGFYGNGAGGSAGGSAFINGAVGGTGAFDGGFGGGGCRVGSFGGGGGGGYTGGNANSTQDGSSARYGGGGSYNSGTSQTNSDGVNNGHGSVTIELL